MSAILFDNQFVIDNLSHLTHHRDGFKGAMLEPEILERKCPLDNDRHTEAPSLSNSLGVLDKLPLELLTAILVILDLQTLTELRRVNHRSRHAVDTIREYKEIVVHAPASLRAALSINVASLISCQQLHQTLCSQECVACGRFGPFLYLITCSRVCYPCLITKEEFLPLTKMHAKLAFGIARSDISKLPMAISRPGRYSQLLQKEKARKQLVDRTSAITAGAKLHGSIEKMKKYTQQERNRLLNVTNRHPYPPAFTNVHDRMGANPIRFMCAIKFPWLDRTRDKLEWGLNCIGCRDIFHHETKDGKQDWRWLYTLDGYLKHIYDCPGSILKLKKLSQAQEID